MRTVILISSALISPLVSLGALSLWLGTSGLGGWYVLQSAFDIHLHSSLFLRKGDFRSHQKLRLASSALGCPPLWEGHPEMLPSWELPLLTVRESGLSTLFILELYTIYTIYWFTMNFFPLKHSPNKMGFCSSWCTFWMHLLPVAFS